MSQLLVTNYANVSYSELEEEYNTSIKVLTHGYINLSDPKNIKKLYAKVRPIIEAASPEDFLVISGAAIISIMIVNWWLEFHPSVRMLTFTRKENGGKYNEVILTRTSITPDNGISG